MANQYNAKTPAKIQTLLDSIRTALGGVDVDYKDSVGATLTIAIADDGRSVALSVTPSDKGLNNRFGAADASGRLTQTSPKIIPTTSLP